MFLTDLDMRATRPGYASLLAPLVWEDAKYGRVEIPAGTSTDLGSTPHTLRRFSAFDPWVTARRPAVVHDYLYDRGRWPDGRPVTRSEADEFLRVAMVAEGHSAAVARSWWLGVRMGGVWPWGRYRRADKPPPPTAS